MQGAEHLKSPIHILEVDVVDSTPTPEHIQLMAADYITRVLVLTQQNKPRQALVRVAQLNALTQEFPLLLRAYPGLSVFIKYGTFYCSGPKVKAAAMFLLSQKAAPILKRMSAAVAEYLAERKREEEDKAHAARTAPKPPTPKMQRIGNSLAVLNKILPKVTDEAKLRAAAYQERNAARSREAVSATDAFILEQAGQVKARELLVCESAIVRAAIVLPEAHVSRLAHKNNCIEYGMHKVMGSYWIMTDALLVGVARRDESGATRDDNAIKATLVEILHLRNAARTRAGSSGYVPVGPCVSSGSHRYFLLFDGGLVRDGHVAVKRWSFFRVPGASGIELKNDKEVG